MVDPRRRFGVSGRDRGAFAEPRRLSFGSQRPQFRRQRGAGIHLQQCLPVLLAQRAEGGQWRDHGHRTTIGAARHEYVAVGEQRGNRDARGRPVLIRRDGADRQQFAEFQYAGCHQRRRRRGRPVLSTSYSGLAQGTRRYSRHFRLPGTHRQIQRRGERQCGQRLLDARIRSRRNLLHIRG